MNIAWLLVDLPRCIAVALKPLEHVVKRREPEKLASSDDWSGNALFIGMILMSCLLLCFGSIGMIMYSVVLCGRKKKKQKEKDEKADEKPKTDKTELSDNPDVSETSEREYSEPTKAATSEVDVDLKEAPKRNDDPLVEQPAQQTKKSDPISRSDKSGKPKRKNGARNYSSDSISAPKMPSERASYVSEGFDDDDSKDESMRSADSTNSLSDPREARNGGGKRRR